MKKIFLLLFIFATSACSLQAQTYNEWMRQKKTQRKYLLQQIAALQVYIGYAKKGYQLAKEGLTTISAFTKGEFNLHGEFFNLLKTVNPEIRRYVRVADILSLQVKIIQNYNKSFRHITHSGAFTSSELNYIKTVFARLLEDCEKNLDELIALTTNGTLQMQDNERMERIDKLYLDMQDKFTFCRSFANDAQSLAASRLKEQADIQNSRALHGIKNE